MENTKFIACCKALSDETRWEIVNMLKKGTLCACEILNKFSLSQPTLSYHMKQLADCGLINVEKDWKWSYYSLNMETISVLKNCFDFEPETKENYKCKDII